MKEIKLTQGKVALVDDEDFEYLNQWKWCAHKAGKKFYARRACILNKKYQEIKMHRLIMDCVEGDGKIVDHKDGDTLNNSKNNLRICSHKNNIRNMNKSTLHTSKYKGVHLRKNGKWQARITKNYKLIHIGYFKIEAEAAKAYNIMASELFGEFANLNQI